MLELKIGLRLTDEQESRLKVLADTVDAQDAAQAKALKEWNYLPPRPDQDPQGLRRWFRRW